MKKVKITFRLSVHQIAYGLQTIRQLEPTYQLISLNDMVKTIYHDYLSKMTLNRTSIVPMGIINEVNRHINMPASKITLENLFSSETESPDEFEEQDFEQDLEEQKEKDLEALEEDLEEPEDVYDPDEELSEETLAEIDQMVTQTKRFSSLLKASEFNDPNITESDISTITNFSPPKDWME